jgi:hypothetical protein
MQASSTDVCPRKGCQVIFGYTQVMSVELITPLTPVISGAFNTPG